MNDLNTGKGTVRPLDADAFMEITITEENGIVTKADFRCTDEAVLTRCGETICRALPDHPVTDLFYMSNNVVYYNIEPELQLSELFNATMAVFAAKRAAADWCRKNGVAVPADADACGCVTEESEGGELK